MPNSKSITTKILLLVVVVLAILVIRQQWSTRSPSSVLVTDPDSATTIDTKKFVRDVEKIISFNDDNIDFSITYRSNVMEISRNVFKQEETVLFDGDDWEADEPDASAQPDNYTISNSSTKVNNPEALAAAKKENEEKSSEPDTTVYTSSAATNSGNAAKTEEPKTVANSNVGRPAVAPSNAVATSLPFVFIGETSNADGSNQQLMLLHSPSQKEITARLGDTIHNRWRVVRLGQGYLELEDLTTKIRQRLNIGEYPDTVVKSVKNNSNVVDNSTVTANLAPSNAKNAIKDNGKNSSKDREGTAEGTLDTEIFRRSAQPLTYTELMQKRAKARQEQKRTQNVDKH
jgi:hypothetical protein